MELPQFFRSRRGSELVGIVVIATGLAIGAALLSYHPNDSSAFFTSTTDEIQNLIGYYGATLAWILAGFFGVVSLIFPLALLVVGWNRFWGKELEYLQTKLIGFLILVLSLPPLADLMIGEFWFRGGLLRPGGYVGAEIRNLVSRNLNSAGAGIMLSTAFLVGLLLATRISLGSIFLEIRDVVMEFFRRTALHWARLRERRRKEKMKSTVVRKHLEHVETPETEPPRLTAIDGGLAEDVPRDKTLVVRQVRGPGRFQIRKVTKADLRKVRAELVSGAPEDFMSFYGEKAPETEPAIARMELDRVSRPKPSAAHEPPAGSEFHPRNPEKPAARKSAPATISLSKERLPYVNLLDPGSGGASIDESVHRHFLEIGRAIEERCREFSVDGEVTAYHPGPVVTTFEFKPSAGVKYAKIVNLSDDLALALKAESIRIERISGSSTVGIELPNRKRELIALRDIIDTPVFEQASSLLTLALGKDIHGEPVVTDLGRMPHLLVAGATGAGKSVGLNSMILSLLYKALPRELRMLMIDPKMVELKIYEDIPHLLHPIVTDPKLASNALIWAVQEMENRYRTLAGCGVRNIDQFNAMLKNPESRRLPLTVDPEKIGEMEAMHYIVIIIDEFADLMMIAPKDVEDSVTRLAQKARAVGIHLIIATQRPSVDVITGVIKANFPSRISYQVASKVDSRTILDTQGAEKLLGNGDLLFLPPGTARIRRLHGAFVSEREIADVVQFARKNQGDPEFVEEITKIPEEKSSVDGIEYLSDPRYDDAIRVVLETGQASASYLQRRMKLGYSRAARLIEMMEANGIVGPSQGSKPRDILVDRDGYLAAIEG